jgi:hypothetical protein
VKYYYVLLLACYSSLASAQSADPSDAGSGGESRTPTEHIFIITTDGFRWQEIFAGADSSMINDDHFVKDKTLMKDLYWDSTADLRRRKLMPFFWNVIAKEGQLYGNRALDNKVNMSNAYWISYPGYNELLSGYPDPVFIPNLKINNRNETVLEFLNQQPRYKGKVVAFTSWNVFPYILNAKRSKIPVNSGYKPIADVTDTASLMINGVESEIKHKTHTRYDLLTFSAAKEYITRKHPSVVFLGFGETDEAAHAYRYDLYLQEAAQVDRMISELWYIVQTDPEYKDHTTFIITTDHGRGEDADTWHTHNPFTKGSGETWIACIGAGIQPMGEMKQPEQIYGNQVAATIGQLLGEQFVTDRPVGKAISLPAVPVSETISFKPVVTAIADGGEK